MAVLPSDTVLVYPVTGGLGGPISNIRIPNNVVNNLWPNVEMSDLEVGKTWYTLVYLYNDNKTNETLDNVRLFVYQSTVSQYTDIAIAIGQAPINSAETEIANKESPPPGITNWTKGQTEDDSLFIGRLPPRSFKSVWLRLTINVAPSGSSFPGDNYVLLSRHNPEAGPLLGAGPGLPGEEPLPPPPGSPPPSPPPGQSVNDQFGIRMIYPTSSAQNASAPFFLAATNPHLASRFDPGGTISDNGNGSYYSNVVAPYLKMYSAGEGGNVKAAAQSFANSADTYDHSDIEARGYWWKPNDWRAVEATGMFTVTDAGGAALGARGIQVVFRELTHSPSVASGCGAPNYGLWLGDDGRVAFNKSHYNLEPDPTPCDDNQFLPRPAFSSPRLGVNTGSLRNKFFGFKGIIWNFIFDGVPAGWQWYAPETFNMQSGSPFPIAGNPVYQDWQIRYKQSEQYWYVVHRDEPIGAEIDWHGAFYNYANAAKYLTYLRDNVLPSGPGVHMEIWIDKDQTNTWIRQGVFDDAGYWLTGSNSNLDCPGGERCGGAHDQLLTWASPVVSFVPDSYPVGGFHWARLSVREISQPWTTYQYTSAGTTSTTPPPAPPPPPSPPSPPPGSPPPPPSPPPPAAPTKDAFGINWIYPRVTNGTLWQSTTWSNGNNRTVSTPCGSGDPDDSKLQHTGGGASVCTIFGNGIMRVTEGGRISVKGNYRNCESTVYLRYSSSADGIVHLQPKTEHYCLGSGDGPGSTQDHDLFGGYILYIDEREQALYWKKEHSHNVGYTPRLGQVSQAMSSSSWLGVKAICYNVGSTVRLEAWIDTTGGANGGTWTKKITLTDNGTWAINGTADPAEPDIMREGAIRADNPAGEYFEYKWMSFREIVPPT